MLRVCAPVKVARQRDSAEFGTVFGVHTVSPRSHLYRFSRGPSAFPDSACKDLFFIQKNNKQGQSSQAKVESHSRPYSWVARKDNRATRVPHRTAPHCCRRHHRRKQHRNTLVGIEAVYRKPTKKTRTKKTT